MPTGKATASVDGQTIAETTEWEEVEGNVYFPPQAVRKDEYFTDTDLHTHCPWKGDASYYSITVGGKKLDNAAWYYPTPKAEAQNIKDYVAFYKTKVNVTKTTA